MKGPLHVLLKWVLAFVYGLVGFLMGLIAAFLAMKVLLIVLGAAVLSAKTVQVVVLVVAASAGLAAVAGYLRHR